MLMVSADGRHGAGLPKRRALSVYISTLWRTKARVFGTVRANCDQIRDRTPLCSHQQFVAE